MSDSELGSDFERFMEETISTTASSGGSESTLPSSGSRVSSRPRSGLSHDGSTASLSELQERKVLTDLNSLTLGQSWLKSAAGHGAGSSSKPSSRSSPEASLSKPLEELSSVPISSYSKDSLDGETTERVPSQAIGQDTLEEIADKEKFFKDLQAERQGSVDYAALNAQMTMTGTITSFRLPDPSSGEGTETEEEAMTPSTVDSEPETVSSEPAAELPSSPEKREDTFYSETVASSSGHASKDTPHLDESLEGSLPQQSEQKTSKSMPKKTNNLDMAKVSSASISTSSLSSSSLSYSVESDANSSAKTSVEVVSRQEMFQSRHSAGKESESVNSSLLARQQRNTDWRLSGSHRPSNQSSDSLTHRSSSSSESSSTAKEDKSVSRNDTDCSLSRTGTGARDSTAKPEQDPVVSAEHPLPFSQSFTLPDDTRGFDLSPIHTSVSSNQDKMQQSGSATRMQLTSRTSQAGVGLETPIPAASHPVGLQSAHKKEIFPQQEAFSDAQQTSSRVQNEIQAFLGPTDPGVSVHVPVATGQKEVVHDWLSSDRRAGAESRPAGVPPEPLEQQRDPLGQQREPLEQQRDPLEQQRDPLGQQREPLEQQRDPLGQQREPLEQQRDPLGQQRDPLGQQREPRASISVALPSVALHRSSTAAGSGGGGSLEKNLQDVYSQKRSIDRDIEEVQAALQAAGLSGLSESEEEEEEEQMEEEEVGDFLQKRDDIDIKSLLREITREEILTTSKQIIRKREEEMNTSQHQQTAQPKSSNLKGGAKVIPGKPKTPRSTVRSAGVQGGKSQPGKNAKSQNLRRGAPKLQPPSSKLPVRTAGKASVTPSAAKSRTVVSAKARISEIDSDTEAKGTHQDHQDYSREAKLLEELSSVRDTLAKEKSGRDELEAKWIAREKEILRREELSKHQYQKEMKDMKSELFSMSAKLRERGVREATRRQLGEEASADKNLDLGEKDRLLKEISDQDKLLEGYQKENERLYHGLTRSQQELKSVRDTLTQENQSLRTELTNERAKQEMRLSPAKNLDRPPAPHSPPNLREQQTEERVARLQGSLQQTGQEREKLLGKVSQLEQMVSSYESGARRLAQERDDLRKHLSSLVPAEAVQRVRRELGSEVEELQKRVRWYDENQRLLDREAGLLREKDQQIRELALRVERAEEELCKQKKIVKDRSSDARRIKDLERQIKEMETIIRRRFPNSLTAMIYATSHEDRGDPQGPGLQAPQTALYLERKARAMEKELQSKDEEHLLRTQALQQQYTGMEMKYEAEVKNLKSKLSEYQSLAATSRKETQPHSTVQSLQKELERRKVVYQTKVSALQEEIGRLRRGDDPKKTRGLPKEEERDGEIVSAPNKVTEGGNEEVDVLRKELSLRKHEYQSMRRERDTLSKQGEHLQQQVEELGRENSQLREELGKRESSREKAHKEIQQESSSLKAQLKQLQLASTQQRVDLQGQLARTESLHRQLKEDMLGKISSLQEQNRREVASIVANHNKENSESVVIKLRSQVANQKVEIEHLKEKAQAFRFDAEALIACQLRMKTLEGKMKGLALELVEAKRYHSPEMHHYNILLTKIASLENKLTALQERREVWFEQHAQPSQPPLQEVEKKWKVRLLEKDAELEMFRSQIDDILATLSSLTPSHVNPF